MPPLLSLPEIAGALDADVRAVLALVDQGVLELERLDEPRVSVSAVAAFSASASVGVAAEPRRPAGARGNGGEQRPGPSAGDELRAIAPAEFAALVDEALAVRAA